MEGLPGWARAALRHWPLLPGLVLGAALRFSNLSSGFLYGDEAEYATVAGSLAADPRDLSYPEIEGFGKVPFVSQPPFLLYLFALATHLTGSAELGPALVSALLGTATVGVTYAWGVILRGRRMGALAALFLAVLPFHVSISRGGLLDAGLTFLFAATLLAFACWTRRPTRRRSLAVGVLGGLTALAKLPGILVFGPIVLSPAIIAILEMRRLKDPDARPQARERLQRLAGNCSWATIPVLLMGLAYLSFLWYLRATRDLWLKLGWQAARVEGSASGATHRHWEWYFADPGVGLPVQYGVVVLGLAAAGFVLAGRAALRQPSGTRAAVAALLAWPVMILGFFLASERKEWSYPMPAAPALCLLAAWTLDAFGCWQRERMVRDAVLPRHAQAASLAVVAVLAVLAAYVPAATAREDWASPGGYGFGVKEAALWIHEEDPQAKQVGTLLGRFTLHFYNGHDTYHYFVNHTFVEDEIEAGRIRYVVLDTYLNITYERVWIEGILERHDGRLVQEYDPGTGRARTQVYHISP